MEVEFSGAAREVTGSCHIVRASGKTVLLDCGLFQGRRAEVQEKNLRLPIDVSRLDAVVLSHAHIDHAGRLPLLVANGYRKEIHLTPATRDLCEVMLADAAHIQQKDAEFLSRRNRSHAEPLYDAGDVERTIGLMRGTRYETAVEVAPGITATFVDAGHILGSASVTLDCANSGVTTRLVFSGDIGRAGMPIIRDPVPPAGADVVIMESTYGNRDHPTMEDAKQELGRIVRETAARGGRLIIPAFAVGRTQELVYDLHQLAARREIPSLPIFIDSPLATKATGVFERNSDLFDRSEPFLQERTGRDAGVFQFPLLQFTESVEDSKALNQRSGPMVVIAASGMAESGRILHHLLAGASDPRNTILVVGFMAEHTLGRRIAEKRPVLKVFGEEVQLRARVEEIHGYSAHAGCKELVRWVEAVRRSSPRLRDVWLVHGEPPAQDALAGRLSALGFRAHCPTPGTRTDA